MKKKNKVVINQYSSLNLIRSPHIQDKMNKKGKKQAKIKDLLIRQPRNRLASLLKKL
jgi:hypothetical protein